ncbi:PucR family transcriptional regulator [Streptomyces sp. NPDC054956]
MSAAPGLRGPGGRRGGSGPRGRTAGHPGGAAGGGAAGGGRGVRFADAGGARGRDAAQTLEVFLANNCSWTRTAEALHLHVNTVHYRIERVEALTGRDLSRLDHKLDLYAALRCGQADPVAGRVRWRPLRTTGRCGRPWTSPGPSP